MFPGRNALVLTVTCAVFVAVPLFVAGCDSESADFDKSANYTPEALAQELALRYRALNPAAQKSSIGPRKKKSDRAGAAKDKISKKSVTKSTKKSAPTTIDDVLEDIEYKITLVKGSSPAETTRKMIETIASDNSLAESDKKTLTEYVGRLAD